MLSGSMMLHFSYTHLFGLALRPLLREILALLSCLVLCLFWANTSHFPVWTGICWFFLFHTENVMHCMRACVCNACRRAIPFPLFSCLEGIHKSYCWALLCLARLPSPQLQSFWLASINNAILGWGPQFAEMRINLLVRWGTFKLIVVSRNSGN